MSRDLSSLIDDFETKPEETAPKVDNSLSSLIDDFEEDKTAQLKANVFASTPISPDQAAKQWQISKQTKIPVDVVRTQENQIKQMTEINSINYDDLVNNFPKVAAQLADPSKAGAIRDDVDNLSYFEKVFGSVKQEFKTAQENVELADILVKQMVFDVTGNEKFKLNPLEENNLGLIEQSQSQRKDYGLGFVSSIPAYTAAAIPTILNTIPQTLGGAAVGAGAGFAVGGAPGAALGATYGARAGTVYGAGKLETGLAYKELKNLVDEKGKPIEKQVAAGGAIATGIVNGVLELVPFEAATAPIKKAFSKEGIQQIAKSGVAKEYLRNIGQLAAAEGLTEGLQELSNVVFGEAAKAISSGDFKKVGMKDANDTEGLLKFLSDSSERVLESAKAGFGGGLGIGAVTGGVTAAQQLRSQKQQGQQDKSQITDTVEKIKESKTFQRDPELFKDVTKDTLGEQTVYMPAEQVQTFFQTKKPEELEQFFAAVPEAREQLNTALETGGNLELPANSILTAIAQNPAFAEMQNFISTRPESLNEQQAQDAFLNDVADNVKFDEQNKETAIADNEVKNNIKNQILNLGLSKDEEQSAIQTLTSYYDAKSARYGSKEAQKILDTYLGNLEVKNAVFNRLKPLVKNTKIDEFDKFVNQARRFRPKKPTKPLLKFLKEKGGVRLGSNLAGELKSIGINPKTAPGLFRKESGLGDVDNFPASEFLEQFPNSGAEIEGDYISRQAILDLIGRELQGYDISKEISPEEESIYQFLEDLDRLGIDIKTVSNEKIKKAIQQAYQEGQTFEQRQLDEVLEDQEKMNQILDEYLKEQGIEVKTQQERNKAYANLKPSEQLEIIKKQQKIIGKTLDKQLGKIFFQSPQDQTKTEAFKKWFGDSKVVDDNGEPLVVYHGARADFDIFKTDNNNGGSYFTTNKTAAKSYGYGKPIAAYLSLKNPKIMDYKGKSDYDESTGADITREAKTAKEEGYDGLIAYRTHDGERKLDQYVAFYPEQIKSVENKGSFDPNNPNIYYQTKPTFYSGLEKQITDLPQGKGSPEQWTGIIKNLTQKGVKQEEIDWTGVLDWLKEQKGNVTKEQIVDYLKANQIQVEEILKGDTSNKINLVINETPDGYFKVIHPEKGVIYTGSYKEQAQRYIDEYAPDSLTGIQSTKFSKYTLPGGENYRELLMTLPFKEKVPTFEEWKANLEFLGEDPENITLEKYKKKIDYYKPKGTYAKESVYKSSHYDEPNILAHIRFNERTDKDGNKVMFIEEVQSDWHQEGKKKGYKKESSQQTRKELDKLEEDANKLSDEAANLRKEGKTKESLERYNQLEEKRNEIERLRAEISKDTFAVPNAPFKTTWPELAFKRALLWAVENNFDKVAWTTGEQQAERYDLSKQVDEIIYRKNQDNTYTASAIVAGRGNLFGKNISSEKLEDYVGKEIAQRIIAGEGEKKNLGNGGISQQDIWISLSGNGLKVGGEGMKGFYDKILPSMVNKLVKKFGGKVEQDTIKTTNAPQRVIDMYANEPDHPFTKNALAQVHSLEITPAMRDSIQNQGLPLFQNESNPLGQTQFAGQKPIISLFKNKNRSTLFHEFAHIFLQIESEVAKLPDVSDQIKNDWKAIEEWLGVKDGKITTEQHEKFARGFEAYLREGRAPSIGLRKAFRKFRQWLTRIYKNVKALDVEISQPIREVFDRMLATDEAIEDLKNNPIFRADQKILDLLDEEEKARYLKLTEDAKQSGKEKLLSQSLKELSAQKTATYKLAKSQVKARIEKELADNKIYKTLETLKSPEYKLNRSSIENYDGDFLKQLPKHIISENGIDVDMAADFFGFKDGGEMLNSLAAAPSFKSEVNRLTNEEMAAYSDDMMQNGTIEEKAIDASENEARANKILFELNAANKKTKTFVDSKENYKQKAKDILAKKEIRDATQSNLYYLNEIKAAREAGLALGRKDYEKAAEWKKKQLLNHYLYQESKAIRKEVKDALKRFERYKKKPVVGKVWIEEDYRERIVGLLQDFGVAPKDIDHQKTNIAELENWKKEQTAEGVLGLIEFPEIAAFQNKDNINSLTTEEFKDLNDAISNLAHIGEGLRTIEIDGKRAEIEEIADKIVENLKRNIPKDKAELDDPTEREKFIRAFDAYASSLIKTDQITLKIDGEKDLGDFYNAFEKDVREAEYKKLELKDEAYKKLDEIYNKYFGGYKINKKKIYFEQVGKSYSKNAVLVFALNWGTEIGRRRVRDGYNYTNAQVISILSSLTEKELMFVQEIWNMLDSYWPQIKSTNKKLFGIVLQKQRPISFSLKSSDGKIVNLKGGYYPIAFNAESNFASDTKEDLKNLLAGPSVDRINFHASYTKERSQEKITKKIDLSLNPLNKHLDRVITDAAMKEKVWNSYKIINNKKLRAALVKKIGLADYQQLQTWLYDMYGRTQVQEGYLGKMAALSRNITTTYVMGFKLATALIQVTGILNSIVKLGYKNTGAGIWKAFGNGNPLSINQAAKLAFSKSKILKERSNTINREIYEVMDRLQKSNKLLKQIAKFAFLATTKAQMLVDIPTWYGGYYKGLREYNGDDKKAVELADKLLIETQGSSLKQSRSAIERNEAAIIKAFTVFYSYMNVKLNLLVGSARKANFKKPKDIASFASDFMLLFFVDALVTEYLREGISNALSGRDDEDDEENKALHYANLIGGSLSSSVPGISQLYSGLSGYSFMPSGFKGLETVGKGVKNLGIQGIKAATDEEADLLKTLRALNDSAAVFGIGGGAQIDIFLRAMQEEEKGEDVAPIDYVLRKPK